MADKYGVGEDAYCYPGSTVLRNKLDIRDEPTLSEAEQQLSAIAADNVEFSPSSLQPGLPSKHSSTSLF